jgi:hypothetical protein
VTELTSKRLKYTSSAHPIAGARQQQLIRFFTVETTQLLHASESQLTEGVLELIDVDGGGAPVHAAACTAAVQDPPPNKLTSPNRGDAAPRSIDSR